MRIPAPLRRLLLGWLPRWLYDALRIRYRREPFAVRVLLRLSSHRLRRRHPALLALPGVQVRSIARAAWLCEEIGRDSVEDVRQRNLDLVVDALVRGGVDYFVVVTGSQLRHTVAVAAADRAQVLQSLAAELCRAPWYVSSPIGTRGRMRHELAAELRVERLSSVGHLRVSKIYASSPGQLVLGVAHGCDIEFWDEGEAGALVAPRGNRVATILGPEHRRPATTTVRGRVYRTVEPFARPAVLDVRFPVDVVYTWVDGDDPDWRAKKERHLRMVGMAPLNAQAANSARFLSRDELRYSLRSLHMYADWVRTVYLVTDDQVPSWLDVGNPRLRVVSHREIFGRTRGLPTFNSHAIESRLHHIGGLSDQYLYLNDDVFFGRAVAPELFFHGNGLSRFFLSKAQLDLGPAGIADVPVMSAAKNNRQLIANCFGRAVTQKTKHVPHAQQRSLLFEMEARYAEQFARTAGNRFRSHDDISIASALHHYYAYCTGRAVPGEIRYLYADVSDEDTPRRLERLLRRRDYDVFCLNDTDLTGVDAEQQARMVHEFLEAFFPVPSRFELTGDESTVGRLPAARVPDEWCVVDGTGGVLA